MFYAPFDVVLPINIKTKAQSTTVVQPDICVICDIEKLDTAGCFGAPDLIIEIISESTSKKDINDKYQVYEEAGVREYWIVFPDEALIKCYVLKNDEFILNEEYTKGDIASPAIFPDLSFEMDRVFHFKKNQLL